MLKKLFCAEWKAVSKWLLPLHLLLIIITIMGKIILSTGILENQGFVVISFLLTTFYVISIIACTILTMVLLVMRFYKSLFTDEGYLTFTLPVKSHQLIISKLSTATIWILIDGFLVILSLCILLFNRNSFMEMIDHLPEINNGLKIMFGFSGIGAVLFLILYTVCCTIYSIMMFYVSICIGQLMIKHKVLGSILSYIGIYMIIQTLSSIALFIFGFMSADMVNMSEAEILKIYHLIFPLSFVCFAFVSGIFFIISNHIMKYKVNLD